MTRRQSITEVFANLLAPGCGDSSETWVMAKQEMARVEDFLLKSWVVAGDEKPVTDFTFEQLDGTE